MDNNTGQFNQHEVKLAVVQEHLKEQDKHLDRQDKMIYGIYAFLGTLIIAIAGSVLVILPNLRFK